jgi:hypothetical protein
VLGHFNVDGMGSNTSVHLCDSWLFWGLDCLLCDAFIF